MYVYTKDTVASYIDTVDTKENTYIEGHMYNIRNNITTLIHMSRLRACGLAGRNSRNTFVTAGMGPVVVRIGWLRLTVRYGDEYYFFIGRARTNLTERWWALFARYSLLLSCRPSGFPNNAT